MKRQRLLPWVHDPYVRVMYKLGYVEYQECGDSVGHCYRRPQLLGLRKSRS